MHGSHQRPRPPSPAHDASNGRASRSQTAGARPRPGPGAAAVGAHGTPMRRCSAFHHVGRRMAEAAAVAGLHHRPSARRHGVDEGLVDDWCGCRGAAPEHTWLRTRRAGRASSAASCAASMSPVSSRLAAAACTRSTQLSALDRPPTGAGRRCGCSTSESHPSQVQAWPAARRRWGRSRRAACRRSTNCTAPPGLPPAATPRRRRGRCRGGSASAGRCALAAGAAAASSTRCPASTRASSAGPAS